jgi:hypothetical protein
MRQTNAGIEARAGMGSTITELMRQTNAGIEARAGMGSTIAELMRQANAGIEARAGMASGFAAMMRDTNVAVEARNALTSGLEMRLREFDSTIMFARQNRLRIETWALHATFAGIASVFDLARGGIGPDIPRADVIAEAGSALSDVSAAFGSAFPENVSIDAATFERGVELILAKISAIEKSKVRQFVLGLFFSLLLSVLPLLFPHLGKYDSNAGEHPTPLLLPQPPDVAVEPCAVVKAEVLNVRELDSTTSRVVATLRRGTPVTIIEKHEHWINVRWVDAASGSMVRGWVARKHVTALDEAP